jgi:membrane-bound lytic murein transglycosylase B
MWARALLACLVAALLVPAASAQDAPPFEEWLGELMAEARGQGFSDDLLGRTLAGLTPLPHVVASDRAQPEATLTLDEYLRRRLTPEVVRRARELAELHRDLLAQVREAYGVPPRFIVAIWGLESRFGRFGGDVPVFQALATLAWQPRRARFFRAQLYDALRMVDRGHIEPDAMKGSWAGAMGQPQFMPSSYLAYAVDFDGDGRRDIWSSPADVFASIANYLRRAGWRAGESWGREVRAPAAALQASAPRTSGCRAMREMRGPAEAAHWRRLGVRDADGGALSGAAPAGALLRVEGRGFLVHANYDAILAYNCAHHYALAVAMLADAIGPGDEPPAGQVNRNVEP